MLCAPRDVAALRGEICAMREKLRAAHPVKAGQFEVKHSAGGMIDIEFVTQYLVLAHSRAHPALRPNLGNIALLQRAESLGLLPAGAGQAAAAAYRHLRQIQHSARLDERPAHMPAEHMRAQAHAALSVWQAVFGQSARLAD